MRWCPPGSQRGKLGTNAARVAKKLPVDTHDNWDGQCRLGFHPVTTSYYKGGASHVADNPIADDGYLPTPEQHALGGYETWRATSSYLEVEASRKIKTAVVEWLTEVSQPR